MILQNGTMDDQFGQELTVDLYNCDLRKISDGESIKKYIIELCDKVIMMKRYKDPLIEYFGLESPITAGYSMVQLIETSCVSGHFSDHKKSAYINIFSCKWFDTVAAAKFTQKYFGATSSRTKVSQRM